MSLKDTYVSAWEAFLVELAAGSSLTGTINLGGLRLFGFILPADWTTAPVTFRMSPDAGASWVNMLDQNGNEIMCTGDENSYVAIDNVSLFSPLQYLQIRSGSSVAPITQAALRTIKLVLRGV